MNDNFLNTLMIVDSINNSTNTLANKIENTRKEDTSEKDSRIENTREIENIINNFNTLVNTYYIVQSKDREEIEQILIKQCESLYKSGLYDDIKDRLFIPEKIDNLMIDYMKENKPIIEEVFSLLKNKLNELKEVKNNESK